MEGSTRAVHVLDFRKCPHCTDRNSRTAIFKREIQNFLRLRRNYCVSASFSSIVLRSANSLCRFCNPENPKTTRKVIQRTFSIEIHVYIIFKLVLRGPTAVRVAEFPQQGVSWVIQGCLISKSASFFAPSVHTQVFCWSLLVFSHFRFCQILWPG